MKSCILCRNLKRLEIDHVSQVALERGLGCELQGGRQFRTVGGEDNLQQSAPEVGPVRPLSGRGEQELLDHVADVIVIAGTRRSATPVELKWKIDVHRILSLERYTAVTRVCVTVMSSGVPLGAQMA
jgi:hypothetical protein